MCVCVCLSVTKEGGTFSVGGGGYDNDVEGGEDVSGVNGIASEASKLSAVIAKTLRGHYTIQFMCSFWVDCCLHPQCLSQDTLKE